MALHDLSMKMDKQFKSKLHLLSIPLTTLFRMKSSWSLVFLQIERSLLSLCCKTKINTPTMYDVPNKDAMKYEIMANLFAAKRGQVSKRGRAEVIPCGFHKQETTCRWQITSAFPWCCSHCPWAACPTNARAGRRKRTCLSCRCTLARAFRTSVLYSFRSEI